MDIDIRTEHIEHFKPGGEAHQYMTEQGIQLYRFKKDMYAVKNAGMFNMFYSGIVVEMTGSIKPLSRVKLPPHLHQSPTRVEVAPDLWIPVTAHPGSTNTIMTWIFYHSCSGLYCRGRYGPGYLYHVQSWRHVGMGGSYERYHPSTWQACTDPGHHACLNNYPVEGNMNLLFNMYPGGSSE